MIDSILANTDKISMGLLAVIAAFQIVNQFRFALIGRKQDRMRDALVEYMNDGTLRGRKAMAKMTGARR